MWFHGEQPSGKGVEHQPTSIFIPEGCQPLARGRGAPATKTPGRRGSNIRTPEGVPEISEIPPEVILAATSAEVGIILAHPTPGWSAALRPRPRATRCNPSGIRQESSPPNETAPPDGHAQSRKTSQACLKLAPIVAVPLFLSAIFLGVSTGFARATL